MSRSHLHVKSSCKGLVTVRVTIGYGGLRQIIASERNAVVTPLRKAASYEPRIAILGFGVIRS